MSLASLREKLQKGHSHKDDTHTFEITEQSNLIERIASQGNKPDDWLDYITTVAHDVVFPSNVTRHNFLCDLYEKAFTEICADKNRTNEAYAKLFVDYAKLKSEYLPDDALMLLNQARVMVRKFAIVHIVSAEMELIHGDESKAKKILEKALLFEAKPTELLKEAIKNLKEGKQALLTKQEEKRESVKDTSILNTAMRSSSCSSSSSESSGEIKQPKKAPSNFNTLKERMKTLSGNSHKEKDHDTGCCVTDRTGQESNVTMETEPLANAVQEKGSAGATHPSLRSFHSTPMLGSTQKPGMSASEMRWKRPNIDLGPPLRVKKLNLPFQKMCREREEDDDDDNNQDTMSSFKELEPHPGTFGTASHASTSGYQSMLSVTDCTIPMETKTTELAEHKIKDEFKPPTKDIQVPPIKVPTESEQKVRSKTYEVLKPNIQHGENVRQPQKSPVQELDVQPKVPVATPRQENKSSQPTPMLNTPAMKNSGQQMIPNTPNIAGLPVVTVNGLQYSILDTIGRGGSSKVYQVLDFNKKLKAIKCVNLDNANAMIVEGYKNEIKLLQRLQYCDKVIKMYDYEYKEEENKLYVVMEIGNDDLAGFFKVKTRDGKGLSENLIKFYWEVMLEAVQALHKEGIIHSDLKPANFLFVRGDLKLIDFGIAKALQQDKTSVILETQIGTLNYMSPEAIMDSCGDCGSKGRPKFKISVKSDVWSLGCILYNMVYGRTPFQHFRMDFAKLQAIINPEYPIDFPDIPNKHLLDVMKKCLNRDPKQRPSIDELLQHPYLTGSKEDAEEKKETVTNKKLEAIISCVMDKASLSPGTVRSLIKETLNSQESPGSRQKLADSVLHTVTDKTEKKPSPLVQSNIPPNPFKGQSVSMASKRPQGQVTVKQARAPLQALNIHDYQSSQGAAAKSHKS